MHSHRSVKLREERKEFNIMRKVEIVRDSEGNICGYKRKRTDEQIIQDTEEYIASFAEELKAHPEIEFDLEEFKKDYIEIQLDTNCDTSGVWVTENVDGSLEIGYEDYEVPYYGGMDHEYTSQLDKANAEKLKEALSKTYKGSLKEMIYQAFSYNNGETLSHRKYDNFCKDNGIEKNDFCWTF